MSDAKRKCRQYNTTYLKFGFIPSPSNIQLPMCLICNKVFSNEAMKPSRLQEHLQKVHPDKQNKDLSFFTNIRDKFLKAPSVSGLCAGSSKQCDDGLIASYNISKLIAKSGKAHTIGEELILPAVKEILETVLHHSASHSVIQNVPLSNDTVRRRIDEMAEDVEISLCELLVSTEFSLQIDESTLPNNEALLLAYVRFVNKGKIVQEMLFARTLITDTKGESIFNIVKDFFKEKNIPLKNVISIATDGAPAMVGRHRGFIAFFKNEIPGILAIHCVIHRQHLVAKNLSDRLHQSLQYVISAVNKIRSNSLNNRLFTKLCKENDEEFNRLLLHTEVRWLSKGACLNRVWNLFDSVLEFLEEKDVKLKDRLLLFKSDVAYMTDLFAKFNAINLQLQGDELNLITSKSVISAFQKKLTLWKTNFGRQEFSQFPVLADLHKNSEISFDYIQVYCQHLESLHMDFSERFKDILSLEVPQWVMNPFINIETAEIQIQEELIELSTDETLKSSFKGSDRLTEFWLKTNIVHNYPGLWSLVKKFLIAFPSSYLVERGFSTVTDLITKKRNRLDIVTRGDLRLKLTNIEPNIKKLAKNHQVQPSH
ncbi:SCAN domain-containing protein 3-like [Sipha flava]|uniref:SCAN domain-containing protein 3-like n=1 Tax=Sipha flava TaxID=143950 RepID=A0A8B8F7R8_9HEMI|nr:SCAN domain-containing protein 3-like [Sipha flava]